MLRGSVTNRASAVQRTGWVGSDVTAGVDPGATGDFQHRSTASTTYAGGSSDACVGTVEGRPSAARR